MSLEEVKKRINEVNDFSKKNTYFDEEQTAMSIICEEFEKLSSNKTSLKPKF